MLESGIQRKIIKWLESEGHYVARVIKAGKSGTPDLLVCVRGVFVALEVKRPKGGVVSKLQKHHIEKIQKAGGLAGVVRSVADVETILSSLE